MTLAIDKTDQGIAIEEDQEQVVRCVKTDAGVTMYTQKYLEDAGDKIEVSEPVDFVAFRNSNFERELRDQIETLILTCTSGSHLMERGTVSRQAIKNLQN
jgi:hypothetical protein